jgi:aldehyde:ferredoxin oxidoreductase
VTSGFFGKALVVDLSRGEAEPVSLPQTLYRDYLGGYGLGVKVLHERTGAGVDPLGPECILGFVPGLLTGTGVPFSGRFMVVGKSPLTGGWGESNCGGQFGPLLRATGCDGVFLTGVSPGPVYLLLDEGQAVLRDASHLWGLDTVETECGIREEVGKGTHIVSIGPAGEKCALIAALITDGGRAAARSGLGAVMGSKRLKAIAVRGALSVPVHDGKELTRLSREYLQLFRESSSLLPEALFRLTRLSLPLLRRLRIKPSGGPAEAIVHVYREYGTCSGTAFSTQIGDAPVRNWRGVAARDFPLKRSARISDDAVIQYQVRRYHCRACPVGCGGIVRLRGDRYSVEGGHKPEYETLAAFGPLLLNDDLESILYVNDMCNRYGLDTVSTGTVVAFALECVEKGLISREEAGGLELSWGNAEAIVELVHRIGRRDGLGDLLADGVKRAAEQIGQGSEAFAMHAGGQELPMHDPRCEPLLGLAYQADATPARHTTSNGGIYRVESLRDLFASENLTPSGRYAIEDRGRLFALLSQYIHVVSCSGLCTFSLLMGRPPVQEWINAATGWGLDLRELLRIGGRIQTLRHAFNLREGIRPEDFAVPPRASGHPPLEEGPLKGVTLDIGDTVRDYFRTMGWDEATGVPTPESLESVGLFDVAESLRGSGT